MATIIPAPLIQSHRRFRPTPQYLDPPNLLLSTLVGQGKYFGEPGQSPPPLDIQGIRRPRRGQFEEPPNLLVSTLVGQGTYFGAPGQAPPPLDIQAIRRPRRRQFEELINLLTSTLEGQGSFFGAPGQAPPIVDQPYLRRPLRFTDTTQERNVLLYSTPFRNVIGDTDWRRRRITVNDEPQRFLGLTAATYAVTLAQGSYVLTGFTLGLTAAHTLSLSQGSYTLTGNALSISVTPAQVCTPFRSGILPSVQARSSTAPTTQGRGSITVSAVDRSEVVPADCDEG